MLYKNMYLSDGSCIHYKSKFVKNNFFLKDFKNSKNWNFKNLTKTTNLIEEYKRFVLKRK